MPPTAEIEIFVNGEPKTIGSELSIADLLSQMTLKPRFVAVERNTELVPRGQHADCLLAAGDRLEIVTLVGGG